MKTMKKLTSWLLTLAMVLTLAPALGGSARATVGTSWSGAVTADATETVSGVTLTGDATLTINAGVTLTVNAGINTNGHTLTVAGPGELEVTGSGGGAGHPAGYAGVTGDLTVSGGTVTVNGGTGMMGDGGAGVNGTLTVSGGTVTVNGGTGMMGDGGDGLTGSLTLSGGMTEVKGGIAYLGASGGGITGTGTVFLNGGALKVEGGDGTMIGIGDGVTVTIGGGKTYTDGSGTYDSGTGSDALKTALNASAAPFALDWSAFTALPGESGSYLLRNDVTLSEAWTVGNGKNITIDLNGRTINRDLNSAATNGSAVIVDGGSLTLTDSAGEGTLTGGWNVDYGGGVYVNGGTFTMTGGTITGCKASVNGGGVYVDGGTFTMTGGTITGCTASGIGGGVFVHGGTFTMTGGAISSCNAPTGGGGVNADDGATFTMTGGTITGCTGGGIGGSGGGGVRVASYGTFTMTGGTIGGCTTSVNGGGVRVAPYGTFNVSGAAKVTGNQKGSAANNVYLPSGRTITVAGALTDAASIGVSLESTYGDTAFTSGLSGKGEASNFTSDDAAKYVGLDNGEAKLLARTPVTITADSASKTYDGSALTENGFTVTGLEDGDTHTFTVAMTAGSTVTAVGSADNVIATVDGVAVSTGVATPVNSYLVTTANGTLTVENSNTPLVITSASHSWTYDGQTHKDETYTVTYGGVNVTANSTGKVFALPTGDALTITPTAAGVTDCADTADNNNTYTYTLVHDGYYNSKTANYGKLTVTRAANPLSVTASTSVHEGGNTADLSALVSDAEGAVSYAISGEAKGCTVDAGTGAFTSGTETGTVTVAVTAAGSGNYESGTKNITVTVTATYKDAPVPVYFVSPAPAQQLSPTMTFDGGSVAVEPVNAQEGDTVALRTEPDEGYQFARADVTDAQREAVPVRYENGGASFTMPAGKVSIEAVFAPVPAPLGALPRVVASPQKITVNGVVMNVEAYNIGGTNFFKLRDLAALLRGTSAQFHVGYDAARRTVVITRGAAYAGEAGATFTDNSASAVVSSQTVEIDGQSVELRAVNIGGNNFFSLRELSPFFGYDVAYDPVSNEARIESR